MSDFGDECKLKWLFSDVVGDDLWVKWCQFEVVLVLIWKLCLVVVFKEDVVWSEVKVEVLLVLEVCEWLIGILSLIKVVVLV